MRDPGRTSALLFLAALLVATPAGAELPPPAARAVDAIVKDVLARTGAPSASIAIVSEGEIRAAKAYGCARLRPCVRARPAMRYAIGSISKEFTASALLYLEQDGRLSLEDPLARYYPEFHRAGDIRLRQLLSHTAGVQDYWPEDYVLSDMSRAIAPEALIARYAGRELDFEPGSRYQYSNTGYTLAGAIAERAAGLSLFAYLEPRVFKPLGMTTAIDVDQRPLEPTDASPYTRYALGPARPAPATGRGWLFGAGFLAMTAADLARWDAALIGRRVIPEPIVRALGQEVVLANGAGSGYALGLHVGIRSERRYLEHGGEVSGFGSFHRIYPEQGLAVIVFTNLDVSHAAETITDRVSALMLEQLAASEHASLERARATFVDLQRGRLVEKDFTQECRRYFGAQARRDYAHSLAPLGPPLEFRLDHANTRGGFLTRVYRLRAGGKRLLVTARTTADGRYEQYTVVAE
jgi:D-alanyl-D-alanine carboxypeptidase